MANQEDLTGLETDPFNWFYERFCDGKKRKSLPEHLEKVIIHHEIANSVQRSIQGLLEKHGHTFHDFFPDVMISYSTGRRWGFDAESAGPGLLIATGVIQYLFENGIRCYTDLMTPPGKDWREYMLRLKASKVMVALLSETGFESVHCLREMAEAIEHNIEIIPVRIDEKSKRGLDITRDVANMWPDEQLENYANWKSNPSRVKRELELRRFYVINKLTRISSLPARGTILNDEGALDDLIRSIRGELSVVRSLEVCHPHEGRSHSRMKCRGRAVKRLKTTKDDSIDVYLALQTPATVFDNLFERPLQASNLCRLGRQIGEGTSRNMKEVRRHLRSIYLTDGRTYDARAAFRKSSTVRMFVWCAEGINELADAGEELSIDSLGQLFKEEKAPEVALVCMKYGSRLAAEQLHDLGVPKVISVSIDPFGPMGSGLGTALLTFCAGMLAGDDGDGDPLERLQNHVEKLDPHCNCILHSQEKGTPRISRSAPSASEVPIPTIVPKVRPCCAADWFSPKDLKKLKLNVVDLPLLDHIKNCLCGEYEDGERRYYYLKPYTDDDIGKKETWYRVRALALHVCNEIEHDTDILFEGGVHRVSSKKEAEKLQCKLKGTEERVLVWLDVFEDLPLPFHSGKDWTNGFGEDATIMILVTSVTPHVDEAIDSMVGTIIELDCPPELDVAIIRSNAVLTLRPLKETPGSETCILDQIHSPPETSSSYIVERALKTLIFRDIADENYSLGFRRFNGIKVYRDNDSSTKISLAVGDLRLLRTLLDLVLCGEGTERFAQELILEPEKIKFNYSDFASCFENIILQLETPTSKQRMVLAEVKGVKYVRIEGEAGTGKTFLALHSTLDYLEGSESRRVLFVCKNAALAFHFAKWLHRRFTESDAVLEQLCFLCEGMKEPSGFKYNPTNQVLEVKRTGNGVLRFGKIVFDEAHDVFAQREANGTNDFLQVVTQLLVHGNDADLMLLSDISQALVPENEIHYPHSDKLKVVKLIEVCRSTKRVTAGALNYKLGAQADVPFAHTSNGIPLRTYFFPKEVNGGQNTYQRYSERIVVALKETIAQFPGLNFHDRLAIIVPSELFREQLLKVGLEEVLENRLDKSVVFKRAEEASKACRIKNRCVSPHESWIVLDTLSAVNGLEWLFVLCVGLDEEITNDNKMTKHVCAQIYRAMTRAQLFVALINEDIEKGWFEWLNHLDGNEKTFSFEKCLETHNDVATNLMTSRGVFVGGPDNEDGIGSTQDDTASKGERTNWRDSIVQEQWKPDVQEQLNLDLKSSFENVQESRLSNWGVFETSANAKKNDVLMSPFIPVKFVKPLPLQVTKDAGSKSGSMGTPSNQLTTFDDGSVSDFLEAFDLLEQGLMVLDVVQDTTVQSLLQDPGPPSPPPLPKSVTMSHLRKIYISDLQYMLREFRKLERQLLEGERPKVELSAGSKERREKLHLFILHLEDTIRQIDLGCKLEAEGNNKAFASASLEVTKEKEEDDSVQKLEEHILANLLPVNERLRTQLAAHAALS